MMFGQDKMKMVARADALPGRPAPLPLTLPHFVFGRDLKAAVPAGMQQAMFGMGCFWGVERLFWQQPGVWLTMVGYAAGFTPNPTYEETCTQLTGHAEVVRLITRMRDYYDTAQVHAPAKRLRNGVRVGGRFGLARQQQRATHERFTERFEHLLIVPVDLNPLPDLRYFACGIDEVRAALDPHRHFAVHIFLAPRAILLGDGMVDVGK